MKYSSVSFLFMFLLQAHGVFSQVSHKGLMIEPFQNRVFIEEKGQFSDRTIDQGLNPSTPILYGMENAEFNAYFTSSGIKFQFAERKVIPKVERVKIDNRPDERGIETTWHTVELNWLNSNNHTEIIATQKVHEYYNYTGKGSKPNINFAAAFKELIYKNLYDGIDMILELPEEGGIKYRFVVAPNADPSQIAFHWQGIESLVLDNAGNLEIKSAMAFMKDKAPMAYSQVSNQEFPIRYSIEDNVVRFDFEEEHIPSNETIIIDPWITNTSYPNVNRAHDIQEDAAGNIVVHGNHSNYQVQKYNAAGALQWTYVTYSIFLGDIAVDNPGNVYIIGGYSAGKRQKLDPAGVQLWTFSGLVEEWRLAFNYSKTVLTVGGYFINPGDNNLARLDMNTGAISNQIVYGLETRGIATDCNGDMYSLHVTFGSVGTAAGNTLRKTNANFTPGGVIPSGFLLAEAEPGSGYAPNPDYSAQIFQGINGLIVSGLYVYIYDGATIRRVDKGSMTMLNNASVPGGARMMCSGLSADLCGNIYAGSQNGIVQFDSTLNYIQTINTPGTVYDIIFGSADELLVCGDGFVGAFSVNCVEPPPIVASVNNACDGTGSVSISAGGGLTPYTYEWQPGGQTTQTLSGLPAGTYTYTVNDAFCRTFVDSVVIYENPMSTFATITVNGNNNLNSVCLNDTVQFFDNSTSNQGVIVDWQWDFDDGLTSNLQNPEHVYAAAGVYDVELTVTTDLGCIGTLTLQVTVSPLPVADFSATDACLNEANVFADASTVATGSITDWNWDFGDISNSTQQHPSHVYTTAGTYPVELIVTTDNGCLDTLVQDVDVFVLPQADFNIPSTCINEQAQFVSTSTDGDNPINSWEWTIDGTTVLNGSSVQHLFVLGGNYPVQLLVEDQFGCTDSLEQSITISIPPSISLSVNDDCEGEQFVFNNSSSIASGTIDSTHWDMGDGEVYTTASPTHTYVTFGTYTVTFYTESDLACGADTTFQVQVFPNPTAALQWTNVCDGTSIPLNEMSSVPLPGQLLASDWNMDDGNSFVDTMMVGYEYASFGAYAVQLNVQTQHGCTDVATFPVYVHEIPQADFIFSNICEFDSVQFNDQTSLSQGDVVSWDWTFGNGQSHFGSTPSYQTYPADDFYAVQLTVVSDSGCVDVFNDTIEVYPLPMADFAFDSVCFPLPVQFTDLSIPSGSYPITQWNWQFTDGQTSNLQSPQIVFQQFGGYGATFMVTNQVGCKNEITLGDALVHPLPLAAYNANLEHCQTETFIFSNQSVLTVLSDDVISTWNYTLSDGNEIPQPDGNHVYANAGFYPVQLLITTNHGCQDSIVKTVEVFPLPIVDFDADPKDGCLPLFVQFIDESTIASPYSLGQWQWNLGEPDATPVIANPSIVYNPNGLAPNDSASYTIDLTVTSTNGCSSSISYTDLITVHPLPRAAFSADPEKLATTIDPVFEFTDLSTENVTDWQWNFGDRVGSVEQNPEHAYADSGTYQVYLFVETAFGCTDTISYTVMVEPHFTFYVPNAFTPDEDGLNDQFYGRGKYLSTYNMLIFNRWGELIFESNDATFKWDGTYKGKPVEMGEYVYRFNILDWKGNEHEYSGGVMLLR